MVMIPAETILMQEQEAKDRAAANRANVEQLVDQRSRLRFALMDCICWLNEAHSGYISGSGADREWCERRDKIIAEARAALS